MQPSEYSQGQGKGQATVRYYRFQSWAPELYVQEKRRWRSYATDGAWLEHGAGSIPKRIRIRLKEIDEAQAERLVPAGLREIEATESRDLPSATGDSTAPAAIEFRPRAWRFFLLFLAAIMVISVVEVLVVAVAVHGSLWPQGFWRPQLLWILGGWVVWFTLFFLSWGDLRLVQHSSVVVSDTEVSGARHRWVIWTGRWVSISLSELDRARSARRRPFDRLLGRQYLYSVNGARIFLARWAFDPDDLHQLLDLVGLQAGLEPRTSVALR